MKTLIFNGSPRNNGDTISLINELTNYLNGEVEVIHSYNSNIAACIDCRQCQKIPKCSINDDMQGVYESIIKADNIIIASPIYFSELSGSLLSILSRVQMIWSAKHFLKKELISKNKKGAVILCGGGDGDYKKAENTAKTILKHLHARKQYMGCVLSHNTINLKASNDIKTLKEIYHLAKALNS